MPDNITPEEMATLRMQAMFQYAVETAQPTADELRDALIMNFKLSPRINWETMALTWMQREPRKWAGWYPDRCQEVAAMKGIGEDYRG